MESFDLYRIDLLSLPSGKSEIRYELDGSFFTSKEGTEITGGNVNAEVTVCSGETFEVTIDLHGMITLPCNRCLEDVTMPIDCTERFFVKLGEEKNEEDELVIVDKEEGVLNLEWRMYELVVLQIPIIHEHEDGACDQEMAKQLQHHEAGFQKETKEPDERWSALKKLIE